jgi:hypothetical protein
MNTATQQTRNAIARATSTAELTHKWARASYDYSDNMAYLTRYLMHALPQWCADQTFLDADWNAVNWREVAQACAQHPGIAFQPEA